MKILDAIRAWTTRSENELDSVLLSGFSPDSDPDPDLVAIVESLGFDRVLDVARREQLLPYHVTARILPEQSWRDLAHEHPANRDMLYRLAARIYGYRPVLVCEMGSLVLADLLASRNPDLDWKQLFEAGLVPIVEHGEKPCLGPSIQFASYDPSRRDVRAVAESIPSARPDIVYADQSAILALQRDMAACVPGVGRAIGVERPRLKKVVLPDDTRYGKAA